MRDICGPGNRVREIFLIVDTTMTKADVIATRPDPYPCTPNTE